MKRLKRILLAEDDSRDLELTLAAFTEISLTKRVDVVRDGEEALDYLFKQSKYEKRKSGNPVVAIMDIKMPKIDGLEVLKKIKESEELQNIPVVMLSSSKMESDLISSYDLGSNAFVVKPVEYEEFMQTIKRLGLFWGIHNEVL